MIALPLLILCDISISSGSTVMLRASANLITTCSVFVSTRHLVVFQGFPRNFPASIALSCQALPIGARFNRADSLGLDSLFSVGCSSMK